MGPCTSAHKEPLSGLRHFRYRFRRTGLKSISYSSAGDQSGKCSGLVTAGIPGLEPRMTVPETVVLPITPYPTVLQATRLAGFPAAFLWASTPQHELLLYTGFGASTKRAPCAPHSPRQSRSSSSNREPMVRTSAGTEPSSPRTGEGLSFRSSHTPRSPASPAPIASTRRLSPT